MNNRVPELLLIASQRAFSWRVAAMPAKSPSQGLRIVTNRDSRGNADTLEAGQAAKYEAVFVSNLGVVEGVIRFVCQRHKLIASDVDDFGSEVKLRLVENDYEVFRKFQYRSSLRTYLTVVIQRIYLDYRNHLWGKWRPSAEARRLGAVAIRLETLMTREGLRFEQACEHLRTNEGVVATESDLAEIAVRLPVRPRRAMVGEEVLEAVPAGGNALDDGILSNERQAAARRILDALTGAVKALSDQDRLILRLRFQEGLAVADIARALRLHQKPLYRRFDKLLDQLRNALAAAGVDRLEACDVVNRKDLDISLALLGGTRSTASSAPVRRPGDI